MPRHLGAGIRDDDLAVDRGDWLPLGAAHVLLLLVDKTARVTPRDLVVPFEVAYAPLPIGLGTLSLDILAIVVVTSWLRRAFPPAVWRWIHRSSYIAFGTVFLHAALSGTDFGSPLISAIAWSTAAAIAVLGLARIAWGRLPA